MYTKEDVATNLYLPEWGDTPCPLSEWWEKCPDSPLKVSLPNGEYELFTQKGFRHDTESQVGYYATLSRAPYIVGEPFECVVERPEPPKYKGVTELIEYIKFKEEIGGEIIFSPEEFALVLEALNDKLKGLEGKKEPATPYHNVQASGKIRVETPEQSRKVQEVLLELGYEWLTGKGLKNVNSPIITWRHGNIWKCELLSCSSITDLKEHTLSDFGVSNHTLTFADFPIGQPVKHNEYGEGVVVGGVTTLSVAVNFYNEGKGKARYFQHNLHELTKLPTPKPFGPEEERTTIYDQDGYQWELYSLALYPGNFIAYLSGDEDTQCKVNPDGTTATALKFTRTKPEQ